ncbi:MAG: hypothetical protein ACRDT6_08625 [Micromonosporaceae bacterium]
MAEFDEAREEFRSQLGLVRWADVASVQRQGTRRTHRQVVLAGVVTVLVIAGGVGAGAVFADRDRRSPAPPAESVSPSPEDSPSPSPDTSPSPNPSPSAGSPSADATGPDPTTEIPDSALLQPEDAGAGYRVGSQQGEDWVMGFLYAAVCEQRDWTDAHAGASNRGALDHDSKPTIYQAVDRYPPGQGRVYLTDLIEVTDTCRNMRTSTGAAIRLSIVDHGFAGDAAILIRVDHDEDAHDAYHVFVRQGDVVSEVMVLGTEDQARELAVKAAARLCEATPTC